MDMLNKVPIKRYSNEILSDTLFLNNDEIYEQQMYSNVALTYQTVNDQVTLEPEDLPATRHSSGCDDSGVFLEDLPYNSENLSTSTTLDHNFMRLPERKSPEMRQYSIDSGQAGLDSDAERSDDLGLASSSIDSADDLDGDPLPSTLKIQAHVPSKKPPPVPPRKSNTNGKYDYQKISNNLGFVRSESENYVTEIPNIHKLENDEFQETVQTKRPSDNFKWKSEECLKSASESKWCQRTNEKSISVRDRIAMFSVMDTATTPTKKDSTLHRFASENNMKIAPSLENIDKKCDNISSSEIKSAEFSNMNKDAKWNSMYSLSLSSTISTPEVKSDNENFYPPASVSSMMTKTNVTTTLAHITDSGTMPLKVDTENHRYNEKPIVSNYPQTQLTNNKRYSYGPYSLSSIRTPDDLLSKKNTGLLSIIDSRKQTVAKLKGLVIPEKPSQSSTNKALPTIMSNDSFLLHPKPDDIEKDVKRSMLSAASYKTMSLPRTRSELKAKEENSFDRDVPRLLEPPWKTCTSNENSFPKYSPAFKSRTLDLPHALASSLSPTPPSSITSPLSPPPSSPSSICSSNASSATSVATMQQNIFQFSLSHSKPVTPVLPEKPIMSPPSLPSDIEYEGDNSEDSSTSASPMISKLTAKLSTSQNKRPSISTSSTSSGLRCEKPVEFSSTVSSVASGKSSSTDYFTNNNYVNGSSLNDERRKNFSITKPSNEDSSQSSNLHNYINNDDYFGQQKRSLKKSENNRNEYKSNYRNEYSNRESFNAESLNASKEAFFTSSPEINGSYAGSKNGFIASSQETRSLKYRAQPLVFNQSLQKNHGASTKEDRYLDSKYYADTNDRYNAMPCDEPKTFISECEYIPGKSWNQSSELICYKRNRLESEDEDDSHSSLSHRTEDSRPTTDEYLSDATTDSFDKSLDPDLKPRRLSQQKVVLKAVTDGTDSAQKFKALAEKWEHRTDVISPPPPPPPLIPAPRKEQSKSFSAPIPVTSSFLSSIISTSTINSSKLNNCTTSNSILKLPPSLMPRQKETAERLVDRKNFLNSYERAFPKDSLFGIAKRDSRDSYESVLGDSRSRQSSQSGSRDFSDSGSSTDTGSNFSKKLNSRQARTTAERSSNNMRQKYDSRDSLDSLNNVGIPLNKEDDVFFSEDDLEGDKKTISVENAASHKVKDLKLGDKNIGRYSDVPSTDLSKRSLMAGTTSSPMNPWRESSMSRDVPDAFRVNSARDRTADLTNSRKLSKSQASLRDPLENVRIQSSSYFSKNAKSISVSDIRKAFETQCSQNHPATSAKPPPLPPRPPTSESISSHKTNGSPSRQQSLLADHKRLSSLDSTTSADSDPMPSSRYGSEGTLISISRDPYGSVTSLASTTSLISPQELQQLIDEANQSLEESHGGKQQEIQVIVLHREAPAGSIGITLAGGSDYEVKEITVHKVIAGSLSDRDGRIRKGDRVISINGRNLKGTTHREALDILKAPRPEVVLVVARGKSDLNGISPGPDRPKSSSNGRSRIRDGFKNEYPDSTLSIKSPANEFPGNNKLISVQLCKEGAGLGFSIEGGKDSPLGDRPLLIKRIFKGGVADKEGQLDVGDEILSVNGQSVNSMTRTEAWNFLKKLPEEFVVVKVRKHAPCSA